MRHLDEGTLQAWLDRPRSGLDAAECEEIERHLEACSTCAVRVEELGALTDRTRSLLAHVAMPAEPVPGYADVAARARRHHQGSRRRRTWTAAAWAASVAAAVGMGWLSNDVYRGSGVARAPAQGTSEAAREEAATRIAAEAVEGAGADETRKAEAAEPRAAEPATAEPRAIDPRAVDPRAAEGVAAPSAEPSHVAASGTRVVRGRVTDESGRPLSAAQITVDGTGVGALTSQDGTFSLALPGATDDPTNRDLTLTVALIGYRPASRTVDVDAGQALSADFRLEQQAIALEQVVVTGAAPSAERRRVGNSATVRAAADPPGAPWVAATRDDAEAAAGFTLLTLPDLPVVRYDVDESEGAAAVRIVQALPDGNELIVVESRGDVSSLGSREGEPPDGWSRVSAVRDDVRIVALASVGADSLRALVERLR